MFRRFLIASIICVAIIILYTGFTKDLYSNDVCPENMSLDQCYAHLNKKAQDLVKRSKELTQNISQEQYNQMSFAQQIEHIAGKIKDSENEIERIELELETQNVQIRILQRDIEEAQNNISTISQETNQLQNSITKRVSISYKYSFLNPLELILKTNDFEQLLRKLKYVTETRKNDRIILSDLMEQNHILDEEKDQLEKDQLALEKTRIEVEEKKSELFEEKQNLASQQATHSNLLAQSKRDEASYQANLAQIEEAQNQVTQQITTIARQMMERGQIPLNRWVSKGTIIGYQGTTGLTYGSHIHFELENTNGTLINPLSGGYFTLSPGGYVNSGIYHQPVEGGILTQGYWYKSPKENHLAIDIQSRTHGIQSGTYRIPYNSITCRWNWGIATYPPNTPEWRNLPQCDNSGCNFNLRGTGAPVYAIADGFVTHVQDCICTNPYSGTGKYVILKHDDGNSSLYLHLK